MKNGKIQNNKPNKKPSKPKDSDKIVKGSYRIISDKNIPKEENAKEEQE
jgi:hypothetical protein